MDIVIKPCGSLPCELEEFKINGKKADKDDFGEKDGVCTIDYGCVCRTFVVEDDENRISNTMEKYGLTREEFNDVAQRLESVLDVGRCWLCV